MASTDVSPVESLAGFRFELLPHRYRQMWKKCPEEYKSMSEPVLRAEIRKQSRNEPKEYSFLSRLRIAFWTEYERAARSQEMMDGNALYRGVCNGETYLKAYERIPALFAWVICPLAGYLLQRKELEFLAEERMIEVLSESPIREMPDGTKRIDSRLAKVQVDLYELLQNRIYGSITQKISSEQKNVNLNVNTNQDGEAAAQTISLLTNVEEIDRRIKLIQQKRTELQAIPQTIEVDQQRLMRPDQKDG